MSRWTAFVVLGLIGAGGCSDNSTSTPPSSPSVHGSAPVTTSATPSPSPLSTESTTTPATSGPSATTVITEPPSASPASSVPITQAAAGAGDDNTIIDQAITDVNAYWTKEMPKLYPGESYTPFDTSKIYPYGPDDPPPNCGGTGNAPYQDVAGNAFYCPQGDFVAYDDVKLTPQLLQHFGPLTLGVVFAHELGHRVQNLHGLLGGNVPTFVTEQEADCFAGAWVAQLGTGDKTFRVSDNTLDEALSGFLKLRDPLGISPSNDPNAHGSAFQRIGAFEDGYTDGPQKCTTYESGNIQLTPEQFSSLNDELSGGNLPYDQIFPLAEDNLNGFWSQALAGGSTPWTNPKIRPFDPKQGVTCGKRTIKGDAASGQHFYCRDDDTIVFDDVNLMPTAYNDVGDMAAAVLIASDFSERAQHLLGLPTDTKDGALQTDCMTGVWVGTAESGEIDAKLPANAQLALSPGDLDEVVASYLRFHDPGGSTGKDAVAPTFDRIASFRTGFTTAFASGFEAGLAACKVPTASGG